MNDIVYWIWLSLSFTLDTVTFPRLMSHFSDAKEVYDADIREITECIGKKNADHSLLSNKDLTRATEIYEFCTKHNVGMLSYGDERYPSALRDIGTPPALLYYRGTLPDFDRHFCVAAVGTRSLSDYGRKNAFNISYDLATAGATVVSGMAIGIDGVALAGALAAGKPTVAVLGSGIDVCYPSQHLTLARAIVKNGCIMTEFPPHTPPNKYNFPKRNRIISGLSAATVVFEGAERSGALITARYAKDQERAVYALPGNVGTRHSELTELLLKNGAKVCTRAEDIINDFKDSYMGVLNPFLLKEKCPVSLMDALRKYSVSALCPGDDVFVPPHPKSQHKPEFKAQETISAESENREPAVPTVDFDKNALKLYKKIPFSGDCTVESLVDDETPMRDVMKLLLKLEMGKFIVRLPGERVARKTK